MSTSDLEGLSSTASTSRDGGRTRSISVSGGVREESNSAARLDDSQRHRVYIDAHTSLIRVAHNEREIVENEIRRGLQKALE